MQIKDVHMSLPRHDIFMVFKFGVLLRGHCSFSIICGQFS